MTSQSRLRILPLGLRAANFQVTLWHRHHKPARGYKFAVGVLDEENRQLRGIAICGRPVARAFDDGETLEVNRVATDGCPNACSALYGASRRIAREMGYRRIITYTLASEPGTSLRAAGWRRVRETDGGSWSCPSRPRVDQHPTEPKVLWEVLFRPTAAKEPA